MQIGQVSVWVPIVVGVIGLIGIVAGQFVNAWREDRRWKREQHREEIRWERERDREYARLAHESIVDWRERRLNILSDLLQSIVPLIGAANELAVARDEETVRRAADRWSEHIEVTLKLEQRACLICGDEIRQLVSRCTPGVRGSDLIVYCIKYYPDKPIDRFGSIQSVFSSEMKTLLHYRDALFALARSELGANLPMIDKPMLEVD
jgi:hypothetical protein